ncbi:MAG: transcriptional regulator [Cytophagales bacterium CG12_big_fil_rev_8_21_14_0_65_40_12]|nr:MAG: transcriptional regulator [Cytophagales bacterium CG12_big_fil_rev_8_21_14_0_65_40_12]PIW04253.1 MAG: transcriptional regulator [Cytophagales bacterium CG17_big_fil_post_rev_8_21_14_2_50_40_13]
MLEALISSKTRIKLLLRLFLNPESSAHLRGLAEEFEESTNSVRLELNRFESAGMLNSDLVGNKKVFKANIEYPLFKEVRSILLKYTGLHEVIEEVVQKLGDISEVYLTGDLALGKDSDIVSLILIGNPDRHYLLHLINKFEALVPKRIQYLIYSKEEASMLNFDTNNNLLLWHE